MKKRYFAVVLLLLLEMGSLYLMNKSSHNKEVVLDEVKLKELIKNDMISIMTDETGDGTYTEYTKSNTFPSSYTYNASKSQCINEKGNIVNNVLTFDGANAILTSHEGMHCTLYFDKCVGPKGTVLAGKTGITKCEVGGMYRYQGTDNVNNYICFGTSDTSTCTNSTGKSKYLYRIIGVTPNGQLKLILADFLKNSASTPWGYTNSACNSNSSKCDWNGSNLFDSLNGNSFINNNYYNYLNNNEWKQLIDTNHSWKYGVISDDSKVTTYNGLDVYNIESKFSNSVTAAIGAPYIHDFLLSYPEGNPGKSSNASQSWMNRNLSNSVNSYGYWSMTKKENKTIDSSQLAFAYILGTIIATDSFDPEVYTRPVFYLKSNVTLKSGNAGSMSDPYLIDGITAEPEKETLLTKLRENDSSKNLSSSEEGGMYRYQGTKDQVTNNYICFGTYDKTQCINAKDKYLYRIVGITGSGSMLIMFPQRFNPEISDYNSTYVLNGIDRGQTSAYWKNLKWSDSNIYKHFHGIKYEVAPGAPGGSPIMSTNSYINSTTYNYMTSDSVWYSKIDSHDWNYHVVVPPTIVNNINDIKNMEIDNSGLTTSKIGGLYIYDYLYSVSKNGFVNCFNESTPAACSSAWLAEYNNLRFMSRGDISCQSGSGSTCWLEANILSSGRVVASGNDQIGYNYLAFYLSNKEQIASGTGSQSNPYILAQ